jgi:hypothetical protein
MIISLSVFHGELCNNLLPASDFVKCFYERKQFFSSRGRAELPPGPGFQSLVFLTITMRSQAMEFFSFEPG